MTGCDVDMVTLLTLDLWVDKAGLYSATKKKNEGGRVCVANKRVGKYVLAEIWAEEKQMKDR